MSSMLEFEGEDYRGKQRTGAGIAWIEPPRRERKPIYAPKDVRPVEAKPKVRNMLFRICYFVCIICNCMISCAYF